GAAVARPGLVDTEEDYTVFAIDHWEGDAAPDAILTESEATLARILLADLSSLSPDQILEATRARLTYSANDAVVVDWNAAAILDVDPRDALTVLEHVNVELLEMRLLDAQLDALLERSHQALTRYSDRSLWPTGPGAAEMRRLAEHQMDSSLLFEGVNNAMKLIGDQYLARLYRMAAEKMHLPEWDASVLRKLEIAESIYQKIASFHSARRMEILEIIIVLLIAISIIIPFIPGVLSK
ncbi:MAG: hypothetical protein VYC34_00920, partial [Planctomycetota bacterium]|nr:hypothetical protein [Planctomycetota bacterium]